MKKAAELFNSLYNIKLTTDDSNNPNTQATNDDINKWVNDGILNNDRTEIAYYVGPTNFGFNDQSAIEDIAKHICPRKDSDNGVSINDHYEPTTGLDKPFIVISNTETVLATQPTDTQKTGGAHWISWVLLPKQYTTIEGNKKNLKQYQLFFFDSLGTRTLPEGLEKLLYNGGQIKADEKTITLIPFCKQTEIKFIDCNDLTGHQSSVNGVDCGWWAVYYALMTAYTGNTEFLKPIKHKKFSAMALRGLMPLSTQVPTQPSIKPERANTRITAEDKTDSSLKGQEHYPASGLKNTLHGNVYQLKLLMLFLKTALNKGYSFKLATEMNDAEKFDDVVLRYPKTGGETSLPFCASKTHAR